MTDSKVPKSTTAFNNSFKINKTQLTPVVRFHDYDLLPMLSEMLPAFLELHNNLAASL